MAQTESKVSGEVIVVDDARDIVIAIRHPYNDASGLRELFARFCLKNYRGPISHLVASIYQDQTVRFTVYMDVLDVASGLPIRIRMAQTWGSVYADQYPFAAFLNQMLRAAVLHELDECLMDGDKHVTDPHPEFSTLLMPTALRHSSVK